MDNLSAFQRDGIGGNNPPITIGDELRERHAELMKRASDAIAAAADAPAEVNDDATNGKVGELVKIIRKVELALDAAKDKEAEPHQDKLSKVRGFFMEAMKRLEDVRKPLKARHDDYLARKEVAEKARLAKEQEEKREKARIALLNAENAERDKNALTRESQEAERLAKESREARDGAVSEQEIAMADLTDAKLELSKAKTAKLELVADRSRKMRDGIEIDAAQYDAACINADSAVNRAKGMVDGCTELLSSARAKARAAKEEQDRLAAEAAALAKRERAATAEVKSHLGEAERHERQADKIEAKIEGKPGDLVRTHSEHGATSTMGRQWFYEVTDSRLLDKERLWPFIDEEVKRIAYTKWAKLQTVDADKQMPGGRAYQENVGQVR
jgi:hypothetical protein